MHLPTLLPLALLSLTHALQVTLPSPPLTTPIDLTRPVPITWSIQPNAPEDRAAEVDIWFAITNLGGKWQLVANHSNAAADGRSFLWDPAGVVKGLIEENNTVARGRGNEILLKFHDKGTSAGSGFTIGGYEVVGPPGLRMTSKAAGMGAVGWGVVVGVGLGVLMV